MKFHFEINYVQISGELNMAGQIVEIVIEDWNGNELSDKYWENMVLDLLSNGGHL